MPRDKQLTGSTRSEQLDSHKNRGDNHSMKSIHSDGIDWMEIHQWLTIWSAERNVAANLLHRTARLDASQNILSGQMLVLETYVRLRENS